MSVYKRAVDRVRQHPGYLNSKVFEAQIVSQVAPELMVRFIRRQGCLITVRHDLNSRFGGRDYLVNILSEILVLHIAPSGGYSLHKWERQRACSVSNQIAESREEELLNELFDLELVD